MGPTIGNVLNPTSSNVKTLIESELGLRFLQRLNMPESMNLNYLGDESYGAAVNQLFQSLADEQRRGSSDLSAFAPKFYELMQAMADPALETIWVYSWLSFNSRVSKKLNALERVMAVKDLFQFISACSGSCGGVKSVALVTPVVFELCKFVAEELGGKDLSSKSEKKLLKDVVNLSDVILGYVNLSLSASNEEDELSGCVASYPDLARVWMCSKGDESEVLKSFLPLASDGVCKEVVLGGYDMKEVSGVVAAEAFLLKLSLMFLGGIVKSHLEQEMRNWVVGSITALQNHYFFDVLVKILLEPTLSLTYLSVSYDEALLKKVLYDSLILVDYNFLNVKPHPAERMKNIALKRLFMTYEVVQYCRQNGDIKRAALYTDAFAKSKLCSQLVRWMKSQFAANGNATQLNGSSPKAILKWLLSCENQGIVIFDEDMTEYRIRLAYELAKDNYEEPRRGEDGLNSEGNIFFIDKTGDDMDKEADNETNEGLNAAFMAAARKLKENNNKRSKRKPKMSSKRNKLVKLDVTDYSHSDKDVSGSSNSDGSVSDSEVADKTSDEDESDVEQ